MNKGLIFFLGILTGIVLTGMIWIISEKEKIFGKVWFQFGEKAIEVLDKLQKEFNLESSSEVLRMAINLLDFTSRRLNKGYQLVFTPEEEGEEEFVLTKEQKEEKGVIIKITSIEDVKDLPTSDN